MVRARLGKSAGCIVALAVSAGVGCGSSGSHDEPGDDLLDGSATNGALDGAKASDAASGGSEAASGGDGATNPGSPAADASSDASHGPDASNASDAATDTATHADGGTMHHDASVADGSGVVSDASGSGVLPYVIPLTTTSDSFFYEADLTIGDQSFFMDIDTGSTTIAVAGHGCQGCGGISPQYSASSSATDQGMTASSMYQDGSGWSGEIYEDTVTLEHGSPSVVLNLASITSQTMFFEGDAYQGILGLGLAANAEPDTGSYVALASAAAFPSILAFELCNTAGTMWLGGFDVSAASAAPTYTPMLAVNDNNPFYTLNVHDLKLGGTSLGYTTAAAFEEPIVDTGTSLLYLPNRIFTSLLDAINASSGLQALFGGQQLANSSCIRTSGVTDAMVDAQMPSLSLSLPAMTSGAADVTVTSPASRSYLFSQGNGQYCLGVAPGGTTAASTLGITFLRGFVTVLDIENSRIGFAPDTGCATNGGLRVIQPKAWPPKSRPPRGRI